MSGRARSGEARPRIAVVHGRTSPPGLEIHRAIGDVCVPIWVVDSTDPAIDEPSPQRMLRRFGPVIDIAAMSMKQAADAVRPHCPEGIMVFTERQMLTASRLAQELSLPFDVPAVIERLVDKPRQRAALRDGGVPVPDWWTLRAGAPTEDVDRILSEATFPVVLKPQRGTASSYTYFAESARVLLSLLADPENGTNEADFIVEGFIPGTAREIGSDIADFVSVESVASHGIISHLAICGKFTLDPPFRGTGGFLPVDLPAEEVADILDVTTRSLRALGVTTGCSHTEVKLTPKGARVVEVNGRIGGNIAAFIQGSTGLSLPHLAVDIARGLPIADRGLLPCDHITFRVHGQPPMWASEFADIDGLDIVEKIPGVDEAELRQSLNTPVNWRIGAGFLVWLVTARANDHQEMLAVRSQILSTIRTTFK